MLVRSAVFASSLLALLLASAAAHADNPVLVATVGRDDGFNISLTDASGNRVTHLDPGTYAVQVHDLSEIHDFHLFGPGVDEATPVGEKVDVTWTVTLQNGTYRFHCDPHATVMKGSFTVGNVTAPAAATKLSATVGPGRKISLRTANGTKLTLLTGTTKVVIAVNDRSRVDNFHLRGPGVNRATGVRSRGRLTWRLTLRPGAYVYRSDVHRSLRGTFTVTSSG
ncbi:MAG TPA: plastocyanin/azurin family copper-binding protein [Gaiellaceae bacterium]|jgi:plastocyanin|nr:plastocyanin/azurin family copper-binding protein [Gaiellaceae bacterium]